ncbi:3-deoxy-D-manno-octulosonic acid transferase [Qingshengfaniella alkalisoli]|uniref:3-deoxy-D-manno-octulosonic acid transferase n=1 Tax=Qingshengfaniella alkalisoli TaxID=2599296 RepID=A0A5B8J1M2_9RHOB|nr:3-deoxy-D-manno-octulosonic acid transferase [Qingshengfaniella alkalisoli]QDY68377.1 3-deoxy-D-manno-octulosonic acid transferase [Qingshengfaniella alkalisoli]
MGRSIALAIYLAITARAEGWGRRKLQKRLVAGKEDPDRIEERSGHPSLPRPEGRLLWFHAASVGEVLSLIEVMERLAESESDLRFLVTTGTVSSASILSTRLPPRCVHQYVPIDIGGFVTRFLDHWKPDLAVFVESEFWPTLITETRARGIPMLLINARLSAQSAQRWAKLGGALGSLLSRFDAIQAQDDVTASALRRFGYPPEQLLISGTLKEGAPPPPCDENEFARLMGLMKNRPVWLAASTHPGEEETVATAHRQALRSSVKLMMILAPRHPDRGDAIAKMLREDGWKVAQRSAGEDPDDATQIYLADTLGEMGLWYRIAPLSFVGGSLVPVGGHNPFEPAALGSAILCGPHVNNFRDIYARLEDARATRVVHNDGELAAAVVELLQPDRIAPMAYAAWEISSSGAAATDKALALIHDHLPEKVA